VPLGCIKLPMKNAEYSFFQEKIEEEPEEEAGNGS
jgi:hypothetical protein